jgi:hypothetical protein
MDKKNDADRSQLIRRVLPVVLAFLVGALLSARTVSLTLLERPEETEREENLTVTGRYGDVSETREIAFTVNPRAETGEEMRARLDAFLASLPERIRGGNPSLDRVYLGLDLVRECDGIRVEWTSGRPDILDSDGTLYPESYGDGPVTFRIRADAALGDCTGSAEFPITAVRPESDAEMRAYLSMRLESWADWIAGDPAEREVILGTETADGILLDWKRKGTSYAVPFALLAAAVPVYLRAERRMREKKREAETRRAVERAYPGFLDELILFLNAGLVFESAVFRIADMHPEGEHHPFYGRLRRICRDATEKNVPVASGFRAFAHETRIPSLLRFSAVLDDAVLRGVSITSKLELESLLLRNGELRSAEEKGKKAEAKLAFPMALLLGALLLVTLAPVLLEMK